MPCPFCGNPPTAERVFDTDADSDDYGFFAIECRPCGGRIAKGFERFVGVHGDTEEQARAAWNTRARFAP